MSWFTRPTTNTLSPYVRQRWFVEVCYNGRPLEPRPIVQEVAIGDDRDLLGLVEEAALVNTADEIKAPFQYLVRLYRYQEGSNGPVRASRPTLEWAPRERRIRADALRN